MSGNNSFHGNALFREQCISDMREHTVADRLVKGETGDKNRGCAIWCMLGEYNHSLFPYTLGLPVRAAQLVDFYFERMPERSSQTFPVRFLEAVPVGVDIGPVLDRLAIWRLSRLLKHVQNGECRDAISGVIAWHKLALKGVDPDCLAARLAARLAASSMGSSRDRAAAWSALRSAERLSNGSAAYAIDSWTYASVSRSAAIQAEATYFLRLLRQVK